MKEQDLKKILNQIKNKKISVEKGIEILKKGPFNTTGNTFFIPDHHRALRMGLGEVVYAETKKIKQLLHIAENFSQHKEPVLFTRLKNKQIKALAEKYPEARQNRTGKTLVLNAPKEKHSDTTEPFVAIVAAGTSDLPVVEQAAEIDAMISDQTEHLADGAPVAQGPLQVEQAAEVCVAMDTAFEKIVDVGVAGLHRVLFKLDTLQKASVVIVIAGMEGALPSVVGGLVECPVFAVPTSVGYGASFKGLSALLAMLNSCAPGVMVSNIDNGFSAAFAACQVIRMIKKTGTAG